MQSQIFVILLVTIASGFGAEQDCSKKFKSDTSHAAASDKCTQTLKLKQEDMPKEEKDFTATYDDKCFGKCFMNEMKFIKDMKFDRDSIKKDITDHVLDSDMQKKIVDYSMKCVDEAEKANGAMMTKDNECKSPAQYLYCTMKQEEKLDIKC